MKRMLLFIFLGAAVLPGCSRTGPTISAAPAEWLVVTNGAGRQEIRQTLGAPAEQPTPAMDIWRKGDWALRVTYDEGGRATNIVNEMSLK